MRDKISIRRVQTLHPLIRQDIISAVTLAETGFNDRMQIRIAQATRTFDEQNALYAIGRTSPGRKVTNAKGGQSIHNYGLAVDFVLMHDKDNNGTYEEISWDINKDFDEDKQKDWDEVVFVFETFGFSWGGNWRTFKDYPHIEKTFGYSWQELLVKYNNKEFIEGTYFIKLMK